MVGVNQAAIATVSLLGVLYGECRRKDQHANASTSAPSSFGVAPHRGSAAGQVRDDSAMDAGPTTPKPVTPTPGVRERKNSQTPECQALEQPLLALERAAKRCSPGKPSQCRNCVSTLSMCGMHVGDANAPATRDYLAALEQFNASCYVVFSTKPACPPETVATCGPEGICTPSSCVATSH